jgi:hypothetical protein
VREDHDFLQQECPETWLSRAYGITRNQCQPGEGQVYTREAWRGIIGSGAVQGEDAMRTMLELSEETSQQLATLAAYQQRPPEERLRLCLRAYEQ